MQPGDLVRILPTRDVEENYPYLARRIGMCVELKPCTTYPGEQMALIHVPPHRPAWWALEVWAEDMEVLSEAG